MIKMTLKQIFFVNEIKPLKIIFCILICKVLMLSSVEADGNNADKNENLLQCGGFENNCDKYWGQPPVNGNYELKLDANIKYEGRFSGEIKNVGRIGKGDFCSSPVRISQNIHYIIELAVKAEDTTSGELLCVFYKTNGEKHSSFSFRFETGTYDWQKLKYSFVSPKDADSVRIYLRNSGRGIFWFDEISLKKSNVQEDNIITYNGQSFLYRPRFGKEKENPQQYTNKKDYVIYVRKNPRAFYPESIPQSEEIEKEINYFCTPGQYVFVWFMAYALTDLSDVEVSIPAPLINENKSTIEKENINVKVIRFWPQRVTYASTTYYIIPELLEDNHKTNIGKNSNQAFAIQLKVPPGTLPGNYKTIIHFTAADGIKDEIALNIKVLPFTLEKPDGIDWIIYPDPKPDYTDAQLKRYFLDLKEYGITGLVNTWDAERFLTLLDEIKMNGPMVFWGHRIMNKTGNKLNVEISHETYFPAMERQEFQTALKEEAVLYDQYMKKSGIETWYSHLYDEPGANPPKMKASLLKAQVLKEAGIKTYCTVYHYEDLKTLAPYLDIDANPWLARTEADNMKFRELAAQYNLKLWSFGGGCYSGQEGGLMPNRYLSGFLFFKSKVQAHISWTYQRPNGDPYNDFDGTGLEPKDVCITYPAHKLSENSVSVSTLQWEGIREGIDDYKYAYTLAKWIERVRSKGFLKEASDAQARMDELIDSMPWRNDYLVGDSYSRPGNFSNDTATKYRWLFATEIMKLQKILLNGVAK